MQYVRLGEVIHSAKSARCGDDDYPVLSITKSEGIILQSDKFKKRIASQDTSLYKIVCRGQLVQGIHIDEANFGIQDIVDAGIVSPAYKIWDVNSDRIIPKYLEEVLRSPRSIQYYASNFNGSIKRRERLTDKDFLAMEIPCPSLEEQDYTLSVIRKMRHILFYRRKEISAMDDLIKARFVELFGNPMQSDKYGTRKLSSCVKDKSDIVDGPFGSQVNTKVDYIENGEIPVIRTVNVKKMSFSIVDLKYMTREKYESVIRSQVLPGDVILTKVGTIGNVCIFPNTYEEAVLSTTGSCRIRVDDSIMSTVFFAYNLMYLKDHLLKIASTGVQPFLNMNHVRNIAILDVPLAKQLEFSQFVKQIDKSKAAVEASLAETQILFDSLMQRYFG